MNPPKTTPKPPEMITIYAERSVDAAGVITIRPIRIMVPGEEMTAREAAKVLDMNVRNVQRMCDMGEFKTARKSGYGKNAEWRIARREVMDRLAPPAE
jgi:hypothetical protein